jgi:hypothetical protein
MHYDISGSVMAYSKGAMKHVKVYGPVGLESEYDQVNQSGNDMGFELVDQVCTVMYIFSRPDAL